MPWGSWINELPTPGATYHSFCTLHLGRAAVPEAASARGLRGSSRGALLIGRTTIREQPSQCATRQRAYTVVIARFSCGEMETSSVRSREHLPAQTYGRRRR
jgi:hypothetical protein